MTSAASVTLTTAASTTAHPKHTSTTPLRGLRRRRRRRVLVRIRALLLGVRTPSNSARIRTRTRRRRRRRSPRRGVVDVCFGCAVVEAAVVRVTLAAEVTAVARLQCFHLRTILEVFSFKDILGDPHEAGFRNHRAEHCSYY